METNRNIVRRNLLAPTLSKAEILKTLRNDSVIENYINNSLSNLEA